MVGAFVLLLAGYATYAAYGRPAADFAGATDAGHVTAVKAMVATVLAPAGTTFDPYGTSCDAASTSCWTSTTLGPEAMVSALSQTLVAKGSKVRSHTCLKADDTSVQTPDGNEGCDAVLDYRGSKIELTSRRSPLPDNGGRTFLRVDSPGVTPTGNRYRSTAFGPWASVDPLPAAWTTGVTCTQPTSQGCRRYSQRGNTAPALAMPLTQVCASIRAGLRDRFFFGLDVDQAASGSKPASCTIVGHRYRSVGSRDGEYLDVLATSAGPDSTVLKVDLIPGI
jgi:hypothetical protein